MSETVLDVFIACPSDAIEARDAVEQALNDWNRQQGAIENIRLRVSNYKRSAVPVLGRGDGQSVTNDQLVDTAHIVVAIFYHRLGTATSRASSGTAEEIKRAYEAHKPLHVYFLSKNPPPRHNREDFSALSEFRTYLESLGLVATFRSLDSLRDKIVRAINYDVGVLRERGTANLMHPPSANIWSQPVGTSTRQGLSIAVRYDRTSESIEVKNIGKFSLEDVVVGPSLGWELPHGLYPGDLFHGVKVRRLEPFASCHFRINAGKLHSIHVEVSYEQFGDVFRADYAFSLSRF